MKSDSESTTGAGKGHSRPRKRILIEASKLADERMDGIKRYVVELLHAFSRLGLDAEFALDIMINDRVYPLADLPANVAADAQQAENQGQRAIWARRIGMLFPPVLLHPIKWLIPGWASLRFLGKEKSELQVPAIRLAGGSILTLILPPALVSLLQRLVPERLAQYIWKWGILEPPSKNVDPAPYDLIHFSLPNNFHYIRPTSIPTLVTVHDLCHIACPQYLTHGNSITLRMGLDRAVATGAGFISVSHATQQQLIEQYTLDPRRVDTVHNGCSAENFHPVPESADRARVLRKYQIPEGPFLLALSTIEPRKNLALTIDAFDLVVSEPGDRNINLVIAGARGWKSRKVMRTAETARRIHLTGYIDDVDLAAIYSAARGFVYASHYEGFGLPLLEAMHCGLPVIYGNNSSMPEIVGDAGLAVDSNDVNDIARQMQRLVTDDTLARLLGERALERASGFTWDIAATQTATVYRKLIGVEVA